MDEPQPRRPRLSDAVVGDLAADIISGRIVPGSTLPTEPQLCARFGVSRTVVREAIARLADDGLVRVRQGIGTDVQPRDAWNDLDPDLLRVRAERGLIADLLPHLLEVRRMIEVEAAGMAATRRDAADLARLQALVSLMDGAVDDRVAYNDGDVAFHEALIAATANDLLRQVMRPVHQVRRVGSLLTSRDPAVTRASLDGHCEILAAVEAGDADAAREAMARHIGQFERDMARAVLGSSNGKTAAATPAGRSA
jgi:GntR family transcriptional repressor for pyruvate dehydrogenase complex